LPELEAFVIAQRESLTAAPVAAVPVAHFATLKTIDPPIGSLAGNRFTSVGRRAKRILLESDDGDTLVLHLMSAGKLVVGGKRTKSARLVWSSRRGPT
jgi:formamidopyrimidine-DNA glycosylase